MLLFLGLLAGLSFLWHDGRLPMMAMALLFGIYFYYEHRNCYYLKNSPAWRKQRTPTLPKPPEQSV